MSTSKPNNFPDLLQLCAKKAGISLRSLGPSIGEQPSTAGHWKIRRNSPNDAQAEAAGRRLGLEGEALARFQVLAALEHIPDESARLRILATYDGFNALKSRLQAVELRLEKLGEG